MAAPPIQAVWWGGTQGHPAWRGGGEHLPTVRRADHVAQLGRDFGTGRDASSMLWRGSGRKGWTPTHMSMAQLLGTTTALTTWAWAWAPGSPLPSLLITRSQGSQEFTVNSWETMEKRWAEPDMTDGRTDRHRQLRGTTVGSRAFLGAEVPADYNQAGLRHSKPGRTPAPQAARHPLPLFGAEHGLPASRPQSPHPRLTLSLLRKHLPARKPWPGLHLCRTPRVQKRSPHCLHQTRPLRTRSTEDSQSLLRAESGPT